MEDRPRLDVEYTGERGGGFVLDQFILDDAGSVYDSVDPPLGGVHLFQDAPHGIFVPRVGHMVDHSGSGLLDGLPGGTHLPFVEDPAGGVLHLPGGRVFPFPAPGLEDGLFDFL